MIEDDLDDRYITETYFAEQGYKVSLEFFDSAGNVIEYLSEKNARLPDIIVLDAAMRGLETLQQLKFHPEFKTIPVVVVTELTPAHSVKEIYRLGANSVIQKPSTHALTTEKIGTFAKYWLDVVEL